MKRILCLILVALALISCRAAADSKSEESAPSLLVGDGTTQKSYTQADLQQLAATEATFKEVTYKGVTLTELLKAAGYDVATIRAVKAVASDGYSMNYDPPMFQRPDVVVAYARADGPLAAEDGTFRMVIPGAEGKLNVRQLAELRVVP